MFSIDPAELIARPNRLPRSNRDCMVMHPICRVRSFEIQAPYTLRVAFDDLTGQVIDFEPVLHGELYSPLRDLAFFNRVVIDREAWTLVWPNGADFDPATLHDWPRCREAFAGMAAARDAVPA